MSFEFPVKVTELADLIADFQMAGAQIGGTATSVAQNNARKVVRTARRLVPKKTWRLHDSIGVDSENRTEAAALGMGQVGVTIVASAPYAGFVEFGTVNMSPRPYLRPALSQQSPQFRSELADAAAGMVGGKTAARAALRGLSLARGAHHLKAGKALSRLGA